VNNIPCQGDHQLPPDFSARQFQQLATVSE